MPQVADGGQGECKTAETYLPTVEEVKVLACSGVFSPCLHTISPLHVPKSVF